MISTIIEYLISVRESGETIQGGDVIKTIVILADKHSGSIHGLTPPVWQTRQSPQHFRYQKESWHEYYTLARKWRKPDILIDNGDAIEGHQSKQGGAELITTDCNQQSQMACKSLGLWDAKKIFMTYGTKYHTGEGAEDFEYNIARQLDAKIEGNLYLNVEGLTINARHHIGTSGIPHGRATALLKELMWGLVKEAEQGWPKIDILIRSHAHYHYWIEDGSGKIAMVTPGLQLARGRFGSRICSGIVDWGAIRLTINNKRIVKKEVEICRLRGNVPRIIRVK